MKRGVLMTGVVGGFFEGVQLVFQVVQYPIIGIIRSKHVILPLADRFIQAPTL